MSSSGLDCLAIGGLPAPGAGAVTAFHDALFVNLGDDFAVAGEQRLCRTHLGAKRQFAFGETVRPVFLVFFLAAIGLGTASAIRALIHFAARSEISDLRILRRPERTGIEAVATADAQILGVKHDAISWGVKAVDRADRGARRVSAVHAGH